MFFHHLLSPSAGFLLNLQKQYLCQQLCITTKRQFIRINLAGKMQLISVQRNDGEFLLNTD